MTFTGECDACGRRVPVDELTAIDYGDQGNNVGDGSFCADCDGTNPPADFPTEGDTNAE